METPNENQKENNLRFFLSFTIFQKNYNNDNITSYSSW